MKILSVLPGKKTMIFQVEEKRMLSVWTWIAKGIPPSSLGKWNHLQPCLAKSYRLKTSKTYPLSELWTDTKDSSLQPGHCSHASLCLSLFCGWPSTSHPKPIIGLQSLFFHIPARLRGTCQLFEVSSLTSGLRAARWAALACTARSSRISPSAQQVLDSCTRKANSVMIQEAHFGDAAHLGPQSMLCFSFCPTWISPKQWEDNFIWRKKC